MSEDRMDAFTREAGEYLSRLDQLLARDDAPEPEYLVRLSRGVRDGAARAEASTLARVAQRLEDAAGSYASGTITWSEELRRVARQTVSDLQILVRALKRWGPEEEALVREAIGRWSELGGVVHVSALFFDDGGRHVVSEPQEGEWAGIVPVESLLPHRDRALREAAALRPRIEARLGEAAEDPEVRGLLDELFGLIRQAADEGPDSG